VDPLRDGKARLAVGVALAAENQATSTEHPKVAATGRTVEGPVEVLADPLVKRLAVAVETHLELPAARDPEPRTATLAGLLEDGRAGGQPVTGPAAGTGDVAAGADEPVAAVGTVTDGDAGCARRNLPCGRVVAGNPEMLVAVLSGRVSQATGW
jgi:hypothetical protein